MFSLPVPVLTDLNHSIPDSPALCKFLFLHARAICRQKHRQPAAWWAVCLLLAGLLLLSAQSVAAQATPPVDRVAPNATLFIGPRARTTVRLEALRVDATIEQEDERTWAAVQTWFRLQNPLTSTLTLDTIVQGTDSTPPASAVTLTVGSAPQLLTPLDGTNHWRWQAALPGSGRLEPVLAYQVPLGEGALARFYYDPMNGWGRIPGSFRVTLRFPDGMAADQILRVHPAGYVFDGNQLTWSYDNPRELEPLELLMMTPTARRALQAAQAAAATSTTTAAEHLALGRWYHRLATADVGEDSTLFDRYYPQAMAALSRAHELAAGDPQAARLLADLYLAQAERAASGSTIYRALAAAALADARTAGDNSPELQGALADLCLELARTAQADGSWRAAAAYLDQLATLDATILTPAQQAAQQKISRAGALAQATEALARSDLAGARAVIETSWDSSALVVPGAPVAGFLAQEAAVSLATGQQVIRMTLAPRPTQQAVALAVLQRAVADAQTIPGVTAAVDTHTDLLQLTLTIPFHSPTELRDKRSHLAALVAPEPDLALLHNLLAVQDLDITTATEPFWQTQRLTDTLDLPATYRIWTRYGDAYQHAIDDLRTAAAQNETAPLAAVQRALWQAEAAAWHDLAATSEVRYQATLTRTTGLDTTQTWVSGLVSPLAVQLSIADYRGDVMMAAGAAVLLLVLMTAWLLWRFT